jgi:signal transduction histidine kinase
MKPALNILHLEDDPADARLVQETLREEGLEVELTIASDRPKFLAALNRNGYDLILADYRLPAFDGLQALDLWRERWPDKPFLFVTGSLGEEQAVETLKRGATDYILKDHLPRLVPAIKRAVAEAHEHARRQEGEERLRRSEQALRENQLRLEAALDAAKAAARAKDRFLAALSHELRTPLMPALMTVSLLQKDPTLSTSVRAGLEVIRRNIETEARMVNDLLDLSRIVNDKLDLRLDLADAHQIVRRALEVCTGNGQSKDRQIAVDLTARQPFIRADASRLQQVFWNLIQNAIKFTKSQGKISIKSSNDNGRLRIVVADDGRGIEASFLSKIFEPFEQGDREHQQTLQGLGLGLAIARRIVTAHGGSLRAESDGKDRGAIFIVELDTAGAPTEREKRGETQ